MRNSNNDIMNIAASLRTAAINNAEDYYDVAINELTGEVNSVIFDLLKNGIAPVDVLRALNELGNILVSQTQDYDEFKE